MVLPFVSALSPLGVPAAEKVYHPLLSKNTRSICGASVSSGLWTTLGSSHRLPSGGFDCERPIAMSTILSIGNRWEFPSGRFERKDSIHANRTRTP